MGAVPPLDKTLGGLLRDNDERLTLVERRLSKATPIPPLDVSGVLEAGPGIAFDGTGTEVDPLEISVDAAYILPPLPMPLSSVGSGTAFTITAAGGTWANVTGWAALTMTPERDLWVEVLFTTIPSASVGYVAAGVNITGGVTWPPVSDPINEAASAWGNSPFGTSATQQPITGTKVLLIPGGLATTFTPQALRSASSGTQQITYPVLKITPLYWDGAGAVGGYPAITTITAGDGISVTGAGSAASPMVITNTKPEDGSGGGGTTLPTRATVVYTTAMLSAGAREQGVVTIAASYLLQKVQLSGTGRVRLYDTVAHRAADAARAPGTDPDPLVDVGLMVDYAMQTGGTRTLSPLAAGVSFETPTTSVPITVDNLGAGAAVLTVTLTFQRLE